MPVGVEEVNRIACSARTPAFGGPAHVANRVERVTIFDSRFAHPLEGLVKFFTRHRKRQVLATPGPERSELQHEIGLHPDDRERRPFPRALMREAENPRVKSDAFLAIVHVQNEVVQTGCHWRTPWLRAPAAL